MKPGAPCGTVPDEILMILPWPASLIVGTTDRAQLYDPVTLTCITFVHSSYVYFIKRPCGDRGKDVHC